MTLSTAVYKMDYDRIKERYDQIVQLQYEINQEMDSTKKFLVDLMNAPQLMSQSIHKPDYQPVLQEKEQEHLLDKVMTDQVTLFDVLENKIDKDMAIALDDIFDKSLEITSFIDNKDK